MSSNEPVKNGCEVIYEMFHISRHRISWPRTRAHGIVTGKERPCADSKAMMKLN